METELNEGEMRTIKGVVAPEEFLGPRITSFCGNNFMSELNPEAVRQVKVDNQIRFVIFRFKISC